MDEKKNCKKRKSRVKRKVSIFTVMLWIFLISTMITITVNTTKKTNALEGDAQEEQIRVTALKNWNFTGNVNGMDITSSSDISLNLFWEYFETNGVEIELYQDGTKVHSEKLSNREKSYIDLGYWPKYKEDGNEYMYEVYETIPRSFDSYSYSFEESAIGETVPGKYLYSISTAMSAENNSAPEIVDDEYRFTLNNTVDVSGTRNFIADTVQDNSQVHFKAIKSWSTEDSDQDINSYILDKYWERFEYYGIVVELYQNGKMITSGTFSSRGDYAEVDLGTWPKYKGTVPYEYELKEVIPNELSYYEYQISESYMEGARVYVSNINDANSLKYKDTSGGMSSDIPEEYEFYVTNGISYTTFSAAETIDFDINVEWVGDGGNPKFRPQNVDLYFDLYKNYNTEASKRYTYSSTQSNPIDTVQLTYSMYEDEPNYSVSVSQDYIEGYEMTYDTEKIDDSHVKVNIINTYSNKQSIQGQKKWVGDTSDDRPYSITVWLLQDGERYERLTTTSYYDWKFTFNDVPVVEDGKQNSGHEEGYEFKYTFEEETVDGYNVSYDGFNIINTLKERKNIEVVKVWDDNNNIANKRPSSVELQIKSNGDIVDTAYVHSYDDWKHTFRVPKYDEDGVEIEYTVDERDLNSNISKFYQKQINGNVITNKFVVPDEKINIEVIKVWDDEENKLSKRPENVTLQIKTGGVVVAEQTVSASDDWKYTFSVPKYDEKGDEATYTVDEKDLGEEISKFYIKNIVGNTITNKFVIPEDRVKIVGTKVWNDNNNAGGKRDLNVILQLKVGENVISEAEVNDENNWSYEFEVPKYNELGNEIEYYIDEKDTENKFYKKVLTNTTTVTNDFVVPEEFILVKPLIKWEDNDDEYSKRPENVVLQVFNKDKLIEEEKVSVDNNWTYEFKLPKYDELGNEIEYRVDEKDVPKYYEKSIDGYVITNKCIYEPVVDTSDMNIFVYIAIFLVAVIGVIIGIIFIRKNKKTNK